MLDPPFDPESYKVLKVEVTRVTNQRGDTVITQNQSILKLVGWLQRGRERREMK